MLFLALWEQVYPPSGINQGYLLLRVPITAAAFAAAVIYYIRWNDRWFQQHADEEFRLKRLDLDIDRASWVVEMALEWKEEKGSDIPKELIDRLSRNLFTEGEVREPIRHPSEDMLSKVLGASSGLRLQIPGLGEATFNRRGLQALKQAARKEADEKF